MLLCVERAEVFVAAIASELRAATTAYATGATDEWSSRRLWAAEQLRFLAFCMESLARRVASC